MARVFFTSDLHFGHENLCQGLRNMDAESCFALIAFKWNRVVTKRDIVYVLGDITMEKHQNIEHYLSRLNGTIVVVGGNHDTRRCCAEYQRLGITVMGALEYKGFICTHIPVHPREAALYRGNIHGHLHRQDDIDNPCYLGDRYFNVNTEFFDYTPISFERIVQYLNKVRND